MTLSTVSSETDPTHTLQGDNAASRQSRTYSLRPFIQTLTVADVESCTMLEHAAFPPAEQASQEIIQYRLSHCNELGLGLYTSQIEPDLERSLGASDTDTLDGSLATSQNPKLIGHVISTLSTASVVLDQAMSMPRPSSAVISSSQGSSVPTPSGVTPPSGHEPHGRTLCIHSLAVLPAYQRLGLATMLFETYLKRMASQDLADRAALIAHEHLVPWYETFGFVSQGPSQAQHGGGGWIDMVLEWKQ